tara:strand:+ start:1358 stop:1807 length:450 start_codon:yes stop_codon:yes gene_type:complete
MAHFAELESKTDPTGFTSDTQLVVKKVIVVSNDVVPSDEHVDGETWCINLFGGGTWKQTSYNNNFRKQYAGINYVYDSSKNKFIIPQPYESWALDSNDNWQAPVTRPTLDQSNGYVTSWDEDNLRWLGNKISDNSNYRWDVDNTQWVSV